VDIDPAELKAELATNETKRKYSKADWSVTPTSKTAEPYYVGVLAELNTPDEAIRIPVTPLAETDPVRALVFALAAKLLTKDELAATGVDLTPTATDRAGSRAEQLWGVGAVVTLNDLAKAGV
jgi:hypothetical protein